MIDIRLKFTKLFIFKCPLADKFAVSSQKFQFNDLISGGMLLKWMHINIQSGKASRQDRGLPKLISAWAAYIFSRERRMGKQFRPQVAS